ncbi:MAG TPA: SMP-30/gluconolactonase/LRE family protein [Chitinophagaceae bacterium]|nr:SMP-30/gluconolactonase/LRE family protein [Chitinophagaceae bacterium]
MKRILLPLMFLASCSGRISQNQDLHQAKDLTAMNIFSSNIEGPAFDKSGRLYVVNYQRDGTVGKVLPNNEMGIFLELPSGSTANSIQFNSKGEMLMADFTGHNILKADMNTKAITAWVHDERFNQPNDLCINSRDQVFASDPNWKEQTGQLWRADPNGSLHLLESGMGTTNGICLSPDERTLYVNESIQLKVWQYDVDNAGNISNKKLFASFTDHGLDGMKCDKQGNLYITRYGKGAIAVFSPAGKLLREVPLTGKNCSNLVFGGEQGKTVYVTLQDRKGLEYFVNDITGK